MINFGTYKPTYIGRPIDQISTMLGKLDENNRNIVTQYQGLNQALDSLPIDPGDKAIVDRQRQNLTGTLDQIASAKDYSNIEGLLNKATRDFTGNQELKTAVSRTAQYNKHMEEIKNRYNSGKISYTQYSKAKNQLYSPTEANEYGDYDPTYRGLYEPTNSQDIQKFATTVLSTIHPSVSSPPPQSIEHTVGEIKAKIPDAAMLKKLGYDFTGKADTDPSGIRNYTKMSEYNTLSKDTQLNGMVTAAQKDPEMSVYLDEEYDIAKENGYAKTKDEFYKDTFKAYANGISENRTRYQMDNDSDNLLRYAISQANKKEGKTEKDPEVYVNPSLPITVGSNISIDYDKNFGKNLEVETERDGLNWNRYHKPFGTNPELKDTEDQILDAYNFNNPNSKLTVEDFNKLSNAERSKIIIPIVEDFNKRNQSVSGSKPLEIFEYNPKISNVATKQMFGNRNWVKFDANKGINKGGIFKNSVYDVKTGETITADKVNDYLSKRYQGEFPVSVIGTTSDANMATQKSQNIQLNNATAFKIGDDMFIELEPSNLSVDRLKPNLSSISADVNPNGISSKAVKVPGRPKYDYRIAYHNNPNGTITYTINPNDESIPTIISKEYNPNDYGQALVDIHDVYVNKLDEVRAKNKETKITTESKENYITNLVELSKDDTFVALPFEQSPKE